MHYEVYTQNGCINSLKKTAYVLERHAVKSFSEVKFHGKGGGISVSYCLHHHFGNNSTNVFTSPSIDVGKLMWSN